MRIRSDEKRTLIKGLVSDENERSPPRPQSKPYTTARSTRIPNSFHMLPYKTMRTPNPTTPRHWIEMRSAFFFPMPMRTISIRYFAPTSHHLKEWMIRLLFTSSTIEVKMVYESCAFSYREEKALLISMNLMARGCAGVSAHRLRGSARAPVYRQRAPFTLQLLPAGDETFMRERSRSGLRLYV